MKKICITQSNYIPWKGYFDAINSVDEFVVFDDVQYTKRDWRNRNVIKTLQGVNWLTIPVDVKGKYFQKINETKISNAFWKVEHWKILQYNYRNAPFFKELHPVVEEMYRTCNFLYLSEINYHFLSLICGLLEIKTKFISSAEFVLLEGKTERLIDICKKMHATDYFTGPASKAYIDEKLFEMENIRVHFFEYGNYPEYSQQFGGFTHEVTILDLLFNVGIKDAKLHMKSFKNELTNK